MANGRLPHFACYISNTGTTWLAVAHIPSSTGATYCGLTETNSSAPGITIVNGVPGWYYYIIAVW